MAPFNGIGRSLLAWYRKAHRDLPWRRTRDPYRVWVSEIMLQQTRAQAAISYYERFLERYPSVEALAAAGEADVLAIWSGLGYYSRARNLLRAARQVDAAGQFPEEIEALKALPGIGDYTAAAIASIAFGRPHAVVDGNVLRVVARVSNDSADIGAPATRRRFGEIAQTWLVARDPGEFNQALMDLGATVCLPRSPLCTACPISTGCRARQAGTAAQLPVKLRRVELVEVRETLLLVERSGRILLRRRELSLGRMAGFWDLPSPDQLPAARVGAPLGEFRHSITHHRYRISVARAEAKKLPAGHGLFAWMDPRQLEGVPLSTTARKALNLAAKAGAACLRA
ncbi:MAG: A/G-specific adenine glycosylase [Bryobacteraceae bacterium]